MNDDDRRNTDLFKILVELCAKHIMMIEDLQYRLLKFQTICWCIALTFFVAIYLGSSISISEDITLDAIILLYLLTLSSAIGLISGSRYLAYASQKYGFIKEIGRMSAEQGIDIEFINCVTSRNLYILICGG